MSDLLIILAIVFGSLIVATVFTGNWIVFAITVVVGIFFIKFVDEKRRLSEIDGV